jgi:hypothetical protein
MRWDQSPTSCGFGDVQALGNIVSRVLERPCMMLYPVTLAVIMPRVDAASATVERWPMDTTDAITREYSRR